VTLVVLLGGARSGKSALAVRLAVDAGAPVTFVATGESRDEEMAARIELHRRERPVGWTTVEEPLDLRATLESAPAGTVVIDCLSLGRQLTRARAGARRPRAARCGAP
jgi:adenosylcobinamide kinase / adenosylcobinamide-phosphate guanylyltransferase